MIRNFYRCEICTRTHKFDRSWHKTPPKKCGRCTRLKEEFVQTGNGTVAQRLEELEEEE